MFKFKLLYNYFIKAAETIDHKFIGQLYIVFGTLSAILGTFFSYLIRSHLTHSDQPCLLLGNSAFYNSTVTFHCIIVIFMFVMPVLISGFVNIFLMIIVGAPEMVFPRLNKISFLILPFSFLFMFISMFSSFGTPYGPDTDIWIVFIFMSSLSNLLFLG